MGTTGSTSTSASENDEAVLLREWNFERFFPNSLRHSSSDGSNGQPRNKSAFRPVENGSNLAYLEKKKIEEMNNNLKLESRVKSAIFTKNNSNFIKSTKEVPSDSNNNPKKEDSRLSNFVRGFRRENTDFFPLTKRHSAVFESSPLPKQSQIHQRSSAIFQRNRDKGEPILTDFIPKRDLTLTSRPKTQQVQPVQQVALSSNSPQRQSTPVPKNLDFLRREKTESVIFVKNTAARQHMLNQQQVMDPRSTSFFVGRDFFVLLILNQIFLWIIN